MKIELDRWTIKIIPENEQDVAFIEDTMGLYKDGQTIDLERIDDDKGVFRLESDLPKIKNPGNSAAASHTSDTVTYTRPVEDFIDCEGSWDGPPYSRSGIILSTGGTIVDNEKVR
jgi:hypothetical protein